MDNLKLWSAVKTTDTQYTKKGQGGQSGSTSINAHYMMMRATEQFGPIGIGWGYDVLEERIDEAEHVYMTIGKDRILDGINKNHTIKLKLWFKWGDERGSVIDFGHTKYCYKTQRGKWMYDEEVSKKSLTDAIKRCLSKIGICADIYLGEFDDHQYLAEITEEQRIRKENENIDKQQTKQEEESGQHSQFITDIEATENEAELKKLWPIIAAKCLLMSRGTQRQSELMKHYTKKIEGFKND